MTNRAPLVGFDDLAELGDSLRRAGRRIVFTNGCFDLLHVGHARYLRQARGLGDVLVVGVNSDAGVRRLDKGSERPLNPEAERAELLAELKQVDYVVIFEQETPDECIRRLRPDLHVKGGDYRAESLPEAETVRACGGEVVILPLTPGRSTSALVGKLRLAGSGEEKP